jgi:hypothetical protein
MTRDETAEIKRRLNERLKQVLERFWKGYVKRGKIAYCAPTGRKDDLGSFQVYLGTVGKYTGGSWVRSSASIGGDNLFAYGLSGNQSHRANAEVIDRAREFVGLDNARPETPEERRQREDGEAAAAAKRAEDDRRFQEHERARQRTAAEIWGRASQSTARMPRPICWHGASLCRREAGTIVYASMVASPTTDHLSFPTLVCRVDDAFGDLTAIWKIHLDPNKPAKAPVAKAKIGAGVALGGAIRIGGVARAARPRP